ncbi:hypothetical protein V1509DRAFT_84193 [Lipomyces kononenkoae]
MMQSNDTSTASTAASNSWDTPVPSATVSDSWGTPAVSNSWDTPAPSAPDKSWGGKIDASNPNSWDARPTKGAPPSGPVAPSQAQRDTSLIPATDKQWDTPAPALTNDSLDAPTAKPESWDAPTTKPESWDAPTAKPESWDAPTAKSESWDAPTAGPDSWNAPTQASDSWNASTPAPASNSTGQPAEQGDNSWGVAAASASDPQRPNGAFSRKPPGIDQRNSRSSRWGSSANRGYSDGTTESATSKSGAGLGASRWAPSNRPQRRRFEGQRRDNDNERGLFRSGSVNTSGVQSSWSSPNESGSNDRDMRGPAATGSNSWDLNTTTGTAPTADWNTAPVVDAAAGTAHATDWNAAPAVGNWVSDPTSVPGSNVKAPDTQQDLERVTPQSAEQPKAANDNWEAPAQTVNSWGAPALAVDRSQDVVSAEVKEDGPTPLPPLRAQPESNVVPSPAPSWAAAPVFVPKSFSATEQSPSPDVKPTPSTGSSGWDAPVQVPDNNWGTTTAGNGDGNFASVSPAPNSNSETMKAMEPELNDPKPSQSKLTLQSTAATGGSDQSAQPAESPSWDTAAVVAVDNSWDTPNVGSWDTPTPVTSAQDSGWDARKPAEPPLPPSDSYGQARTPGNARNGWGAPREPSSDVGGGLGGSKYSNGGGSYSNGSRGGRFGGTYERRGGYQNDRAEDGSDYGNRGSFRQGPGNHQENERYGNRYGNHGGDSGYAPSEVANGGDNAGSLSSVEGSNNASQSWDAAPSVETLQQRSWGASVTDAADSWDTAPVGATESWGASAGAGKR